MNASFPYIMLSFLVLVGILCFLAMLSDLRTGTNRFAHSHHDVHREQLPLNFWLGVASKGMGVVAAVILSILVAQWLM